MQVSLWKAWLPHLRHILVICRALLIRKKHKCHIPITNFHSLWWVIFARHFYRWNVNCPNAISAPELQKIFLFLLLHEQKFVTAKVSEQNNSATCLHTVWMIQKTTSKRCDSALKNWLNFQRKKQSYNSRSPWLAPSIFTFLTGDGFVTSLWKRDSWDRRDNDCNDVKKWSNARNIPIFLIIYGFVQSSTAIHISPADEECFFQVK